MSGRRRAVLATAAAVVGALGCVTTAAAHIQVTPTTVAPSDPVEFTVLVPSERPAHTTKVDLLLPSGVIPFAYGDAPGWRRRLITAANGATERIVWTGRLAKDGYARFTFLAGTPEKPTTLTWKALQTYDDGTVARWIGSPSSQSPAPVTTVAADAPRQNAGGEGRSVETVAAASPRPQTARVNGSDGTARALGIAGVALGLVGVGLAARRSRAR